MKIVSPQVFLISAPELREDAVRLWLDSIGGLKTLDHMAGSGAERLIELAARRCYKSFDTGLNPNITKIRTDSAEYHENILKQRHGSVLAHAHVTFAMENVSRVLTHELCRNSIGTNESIEDDTDISQESLRYVRLTDLPFSIPPEIDSDEFARQFFIRCIREMEDWQRTLNIHFDIDSIQNFARKKKLTSAFRRLIGMGVATGITFTHSMRSLRWVIEQRTHRSAEHEIRVVYDKVASISTLEWPYLFSDFRAEMVDGVREWVPDYSKV